MDELAQGEIVDAVPLLLGELHARILRGVENCLFGIEPVPARAQDNVRYWSRIAPIHHPKTGIQIRIRTSLLGSSAASFGHLSGCSTFSSTSGKSAGRGVELTARDDVAAGRRIRLRERGPAKIPYFPSTNFAKPAMNSVRSLRIFSSMSWPPASNTCAAPAT